MSETYTKEMYEQDSKDRFFGLGECGHTGIGAYCGVCWGCQPREVKRIAARNRWAYVQRKLGKKV